MANVSIWLDVRRANKKNEFPLKLAVTNKSRVAYVALGINVQRSQWNERKGEVTKHPRRMQLNAFIIDTLTKYRHALMELGAGQGVRELSAKELRDTLMEKVQPGKKSSGAFKAAFDGFIAGKENKRTAAIYRSTWRRIEAFEPKAEWLAFEDVNRAWLEKFNVWMTTSAPKANARGIHLRNIRAVFNWAIDNERTTLYPFRRFKIRMEQTRKRNVSAERLRQIVEADVKKWEQKYVDAFRLSFLLIGINMADLLTLPSDAIKDGRLEYRRAKTHRLYSIKVEPEAQAIIEKYQGKRLLLSWTEGCKDYRSFYLKINPVLKRIAPDVTTYWARHSWATIAASLDIPKETIAHALGHAQSTVTDIYIEFDERKVDAANRRVIDRVFGKSKDL